MEVAEERLETVVEEWKSWGAPKNFSPILPMGSPELMLEKITLALNWQSSLEPVLASFPKNGSQILAGIIEDLSNLDFSRTEVPNIIQALKTNIHHSW